MPCRCHRHHERRHNGRRRSIEEPIATASAGACCAAEAFEAENVITDRLYCCTSPNSVAEELYSGMNTDILLKTCYDGSGPSYYDARKRCVFWPSFAHPRWLTCEELYDVEIG